MAIEIIVNWGSCISHSARRAGLPAVPLHRERAAIYTLPAQEKPGEKAETKIAYIFCVP